MGVSQVGVWEVPQDKAVPSVLVSFPQDQHLILGAEEGIFILNRNDQEATLEMVKDRSQGGPRAGLGLGMAEVLQEPCPHSLQLFPSRTTWVYSINNVLMSLSGLAVRGGACWKGWDQKLRGGGSVGWEVDGHS